MTRTPFPSPGRNTTIESIWRTISGFAWSLVPGSQRSLSLYPLQVSEFSGHLESLSARDYDRELKEPIVREPAWASEYLKMIGFPEIATAIHAWAADCWASADGDSLGFAVAPDLSDGTPVDPEIAAILDRLLAEVLGGAALQPAFDYLLGRGDGNAFLAIGVDTKQARVGRVMFLPPWEMFRIEDRKGQLLGYEQRPQISASEGAVIKIHPALVAHARFRRQGLYGRGLFHEAYPIWKAAERALQNLELASNALAVNPRIHQFPDCVDEGYADAYKKGYESRKQKGLVTDFYLSKGVEIKNLASGGPDLTGLLGIIDLCLRRIGTVSQLPAWRLLIDYAGAKDIATQPALAQSRFIYALRSVVTDEIIRHVCNLELALARIPKERWLYRIIWPPIFVTGQEQDADIAETANKQIQDLN